MFTSEKEYGSKAPSHMLMSGKEGQFINWKKEQTKKVDSIEKGRVDVLKKGAVKHAQYFKGLFYLSREKRRRVMLLPM